MNEPTTPGQSGQDQGQKVPDYIAADLISENAMDQGLTYKDTMFLDEAEVEYLQECYYYVDRLLNERTEAARKLQKLMKEDRVFPAPKTGDPVKNIGDMVEELMRDKAEGVKLMDTVADVTESVLYKLEQHESTKALVTKKEASQMLNPCDTSEEIIAFVASNKLVNASSRQLGEIKRAIAEMVDQETKQVEHVNLWLIGFSDLNKVGYYNQAGNLVHSRTAFPTEKREAAFPYGNQFLQ